MTVRIVEHRPGKDLDDFLRVQRLVYRNDSAWIPPLNMEIRDRLTPRKNPFFQHAEVALFTAWRGDELLGRCSAQIDHEHLAAHDDGAGFFGFFDTLDDAEAAEALLDAAEAWLGARGMKVMRGPFSLSINEESGLLVEGFEHPPVVMMPHSRPYQARLLQGAGFTKCKDLLAWRYQVEPPPPRAQRALDQINALPEVRFRSLDKRRMRQEVDAVLDIFNDAWHDNWGFVPATPSEAAKTAQDLGLLLDPQLAFFAEINERPVAMCVCLPNLNEAARDLDGKLFPFGFAKLLWRLKVRHPTSARLMLLGIRRELRGIKRYGALSTAMYAELARRGVEAGYEWAELGWTLEDNRPINLGIKAMRAEVYKRYRVFEKPIDGAF
ncbi:MAG: hypothetical protein KC543_15040 [Myxococcales bacterium]|nr:hypothetical protein [Myxococcales bacterium]